MAPPDEPSQYDVDLESRTRSLPARGDGLSIPRSLLSPAPSNDAAEDDGAAAIATQLGPGGSIGRYVVLQPLGEGAMGRVLRAYDPKLAREVALKLVKAWALDAKAEERLVREARAMARLNHPNVVGIYDVEVEHRRVLIVMEYVKGTTLRQWFRRSPPWREVLDACRQAGRGLAAAHAAGLVHRDFKPGNVLIGEDGRVRVTDFGLARVPDDPGSDPVTPVVSISRGGDDEPRPRDTRLTRTGAAVGTPAYMAPEQHESLEADARADQYAFCVTLWEGLFGARPFGDEQLESKAQGPPEPPRGRRIPRRVLEVLVRGLSPDPNARWPSMKVLLDRLEGRSSRRRRVWATTTGATVLGAVGLWALLPGSERCKGAEAHLAEVWGTAQRDQVESSLRGTGVGYAEDAWELVRTELDVYRDRWIGMHTEACEATSVRGEQSTETLDLRMACLGRARDDLASAVSVLADADATVAEQAREVVAGLPPLQRCADVEALRHQRVAPADPEVAEAVEGLRRRLAELQWMSRAGHYEQALERLGPLQGRVDALGHPPLRAEMLLLRGQLLARQARPAEAEAALREALSVGLEFEVRSVVMDAVVLLVEEVGAEELRPAEADWLATLGLSLAKQWHQGDEMIASIHRAQGMVRSAQGEPAEAEAELRHALELFRRTEGELHLDVLATRLSLAQVLDQQSKHEAAEAILREVLGHYVSKLGPAHPEVARVHSMLGRCLAQQGRYAEAEAEHRHALSRLEAALGPDHPAVADAANQLGTSLYDQADYDHAEQEYLRALKIIEANPGRTRAAGVVDIANNLAQIEFRRGEIDKAESYARRAVVAAAELHGPQHPDVGRQRNNLAIVLKARGRLDEAEEELQRVLEIYRASLGPEHPRVATALLNLGNLHVQRKDYDRAVADYERAREVIEATLGTEHPKLAVVLFNLGTLHLQRQDLAASRSACQRALEINEASLGPTHPDLGMALACLAQLAMIEERPADAVAQYERALALGGDEGSSAGSRPDLRLGLAQALWATGETAQARDVAKQALVPLRDDPSHREIADEIEQWLATHEGAGP